MDTDSLAAPQRLLDKTWWLSGPTKASPSTPGTPPPEASDYIFSEPGVGWGGTMVEGVRHSQNYSPALHPELLNFQLLKPCYGRWPLTSSPHTAHRTQPVDATVEVFLLPHSFCHRIPAPEWVFLGNQTLPRVKSFKPEPPRHIQFIHAITGPER